MKKAMEYIHHKHCKMLLALSFCKAGTDAQDFTLHYPGFNPDVNMLTTAATSL